MATESFSVTPLTFGDAFEADTDLQSYGPNALAVFAIGYYFKLQDRDEFAAGAITEGEDDKKVDLFHLDLNERRALIAQSYMANEWGRAAAPANKASDLNTAATWLISADIGHIPETLRARATDLRQAIREGEIDRIDLLYVHNCHESSNVDAELSAAARGTRDKVLALGGQAAAPIVVAYKELGLESIEHLFRSADKEILVEGWLDIPEAPLIEEHGENWRAILTSVPAKWLQELHLKHGNSLFSANYRDYLGSSRRRGNINLQITQTAEAEPLNFWVYNNGVTALTHEISLSPAKRIRGVSIINGAQTTGALSDTKSALEPGTRVPFRVVECSNQELIDKIIRYNNTQNEIRPSDRRSGDPTQKRLREEFGAIGISYVHRRSGARLPRNAITAEAIALGLCALHGDPQTAFRNAKDIFNDDAIYDRTFPRLISIEHIYLVRTLSLALDAVKTLLQTKRLAGNATTLEDRQAELLKYSASKHFVFYLIGASAEEIMARRVPDLLEWRALPAQVTLENRSLREAWQATLQAILPHVATILDTRGPASFYEVPRSRDSSKQVATQLKALLASLESVLATQFESLRNRTAT